MIYSYKEVYEATLNYFENDILATDVWINKYALRNRNNELLELTPCDMHHRITNELTEIENTYVHPMSYYTIFDALNDFLYIVPQGSPMYGIGNDTPVSLGNCFVIGDATDSYGSICKIDEEQIQLMKRRGGVGHDLSHIRPKGSFVNNAAHTSTGVVPFMERYSNSTREVAQGGRRGALMLSLDATHSDILDFIQVKKDKTKVIGANISVKLSNNFMVNKSDDAEYNKIWNTIMESAHQCAEPGVLFWDTILNESPTKGYGKEWEPISTNPCGEIPLCPYDSCRLLAFNLYNYVDNKFSPESEFNFKLFAEHIRLAVRIMDDIVDLEIRKINQIINLLATNLDTTQVERNLWQKILDKTTKGRRIGISITGLADMLAAMNLKYATEQATEVAKVVQKFLAITSFIEDINLAKERGAFPLWKIEADKESSYIQRILSEIDDETRNQYLTYGRRHIGMLTISPTGSVSLLTQTSSGIEPVFEIVYTRKRKANQNETYTNIDKNGDKWIEYNVIHKPFKDWYLNSPVNLGNIEDLTISQINQLIKVSPYKNATSGIINVFEKVRMQGFMQKWVDHSISNTVNLPEEVTVEQVSDLYEYAWTVGCKGLTIYRKGSRDSILTDTSVISNSKTSRPPSIPSEVHNVTVDGKAWTIIIGLMDNKPYEIFALQDKGVHIKNTNGTLSKIDKTYSFSSNIVDIDDIVSHYTTGEEEFTTRMISRLLREGIPIIDIINDANKTRTCVSAFSQGIKRVLSRYIDIQSGLTCPFCGKNTYIIEEGCGKCSSCGDSKCN